MSSPKALTIDQLLCYAVYSAGHAFDRVYKPLLQPLGLTYPRYLVMVALWQRDAQTVGELGERLALESNTLTPLLKRLEAEGLVTRSRDLKDERQVRVALTDAGRALEAKAADVPRCVALASGLELAEIVRLRDEISAVTRRLLATA